MLRVSRNISLSALAGVRRKKYVVAGVLSCVIASATKQAKYLRRPETKDYLTTE